MFSLRSKSKDNAASPRLERTPQAHGTVRCPKCETKIEIAGAALLLAEEFSVRCTACLSRSFHTKSEMSATAAGKTNG